MSDIDSEQYKRQAAEAAVACVRSGMVVGLGHGSTAVYALRRLGRLLGTGALREVRGVPCSLQVEREAAALGIPLTTLEDDPVVDVTIDGADEITDALALIKGGGGALLREKIVAQASRREIIIADASKYSPCLGSRFYLPVEVAPFGWRGQAEYIERLGARVTRRMQPDGTPFRTDGGHYLLQCAFGPIADPAGLARMLEARAGIIEHGLFLHLATEAFIAGSDGLRHLTRA